MTKVQSNGSLRKFSYLIEQAPAEGTGDINKEIR